LPRQVGAAGCAWLIEYEGALYHVLSRGNEKQGIFIKDNRKLFLTTAAEMAEQFETDLFSCKSAGKSDKGNVRQI